MSLFSARLTRNWSERVKLLCAAREACRIPIHEARSSCGELGVPRCRI